MHVVKGEIAGATDRKEPPLTIARPQETGADFGLNDGVVRGDLEVI